MNGGVVRVERRRMSEGGGSVVRTRTRGGKQRWNGRICEQKREENRERKQIDDTMEERGRGKMMEGENGRERKKNKRKMRSVFVSLTHSLLTF